MLKGIATRKTIHMFTCLHFVSATDIEWTRGNSGWWSALVSRAANMFWWTVAGQIGLQMQRQTSHKKVKCILFKRGSTDWTASFWSQFSSPPDKQGTKRRYWLLEAARRGGRPLNGDFLLGSRLACQISVQTGSASHWGRQLSLLKRPPDRLSGGQFWKRSCASAWFL